jgi:hypothetical protein
MANAFVVAETPMGELLRQYAESASDGLSVGGYLEVATPDGPALVDVESHHFDPTLDLLSLARSVCMTVEADTYTVNRLTVGTEIAPVWLPSGDKLKTAEARRRIVACISLSASPRGEPSMPFSGQMFLIYIAECTSPSDAALLVRAAEQPNPSTIASLSIAHGRLCLVVIGRSTVMGVDPIESSASIERFREPLARTLAGYPSGDLPS